MLLDFLNDQGFQVEGLDNPDKIRDITALMSGSRMKNVMEIGFNAGLSAEVLLRANPMAHVTSFEIGGTDYLDAAKAYIDDRFPERHTLVIGDSRQTLPVFFSKTQYDLIFIDGCRDYEVASIDLQNSLQVAHNATVVIMDDTIYRSDWEAEYTHGPSRVWSEFLARGAIRELGRREYGPGCGMAWGSIIEPSATDRCS
jgi:predicted O-methyltransferase YrrM